MFRYAYCVPGTRLAAKETDTKTAFLFVFVRFSKRLALNITSEDVFQPPGQ